MRVRSFAMRNSTGACKLAATVCPTSTLRATTTPSIGASITVCVHIDLRQVDRRLRLRRLCLRLRHLRPRRLRLRPGLVHLRDGLLLRRRRLVHRRLRGLQVHRRRHLRLHQLLVRS